jgi:hypothetical protein
MAALTGSPADLASILSILRGYWAGYRSGHRRYSGAIRTGVKGYDVYLDGAFLGKKGTGGDNLEGIFRFNVVGGQTHTIGIFDGANKYEKPIFFERGVPKTINVPPATTVYA